MCALPLVPSYLAQLPADKRMLLQMSVHLNPVLVAHADGHYSLRESAAVAESIRALLSGEQYRPLLPLAGSDRVSEAALRVLLDRHSSNIDAYLNEIAELLKRLPAAVAHAYRSFTLYAIMRVAEASRDGLFGLVGDRISHSEKRIVQRMVEVLELELDSDARQKLGL